MRKGLIAMAIATGFAGTAHSAASVTLYGIVDAGIGYSQTKISQGDRWIKERDIGLINSVKNGNRWGLKGTEDLGNGTSAIFQLESGFELGDGKSAQGGRLFGRQAYIGLSSADWGTLTLGRVYSLAIDTVSSLNPFGVGYMQAGVNQGAFGSSTFARMDNAVKYMTPKFGGFKFGVGYGGKNSKTTSEVGLNDFEERNASNWITAGAIFDNGPVTLAASYDRFRTNYGNLDGELKTTTQMWNLFGAYDFEAIKIYLGYGQVRGSMSNSVIVGAGAGSTGLNGVLNEFTTHTNPQGLNYAETNGYRQHAWQVGLSAPIGDNGQVLFSYQGSATKNKDDAFDGVKGQLNIFSLGYVHTLSKRTSIYAIASYGSGKLKFENTENVKLKSTVVGMGMNHHF